jgi:hypothetical protein
LSVLFLLFTLAEVRQFFHSFSVIPSIKPLETVTLSHPWKPAIIDL